MQVRLLLAKTGRLYPDRGPTRPTRPNHLPPPVQKKQPQAALRAHAGWYDQAMRALKRKGWHAQAMQARERKGWHAPNQTSDQERHS